MLRPSQIEAVAAVSGSSRLLLADVGTGKTAVALTAVRMRKGRTLLISTVRICECTWPAEIKLWAPELTYQSIAGATAAKRAKAVNGNAHIVGINFESVKSLVQQFGTKLPEIFDNLVIDESSKLENPNSNVFKALKPLFPLFKWRLPMTGTPRANYLADFWSHSYIADLGASLGLFREAFRQQFFQPRQTPFGLQYRPLPTAADEIKALMAPSTHRLIFDGTRPEIVTQDITLPLNKHVARILEDGHEDFFLTRVVRTETKDGFQFSKHDIITKHIQLASGCVYGTVDWPEDTPYVVVHQDKYKALQDFVTELHGEPLLVVFNYEHEKSNLLDLFPSAEILDGPTQIDMWNRGEIPVGLIHPLSAAHGLNLQHGGSTLLWFSPPPTEDAELYAQTVGRLARSGQKETTVKVFRLIMEGTHDKSIYNNIEAKLTAQSKTLEAW